MFHSVRQGIGKVRYMNVISFRFLVSNKEIGLTLAGGAGAAGGGGVAAWAGGGSGAPINFFNLLNMVGVEEDYSPQCPPEDLVKCGS